MRGVERLPSQLKSIGCFFSRQMSLTYNTRKGLLEFNIPMMFRIFWHIKQIELFFLNLSKILLLIWGTKNGLFLPQKPIWKCYWNKNATDLPVRVGTTHYDRRSQYSDIRRGCSKIFEKKDEKLCSGNLFKRKWHIPVLLVTHPRQTFHKSNNSDLSSILSFWAVGRPLKAGIQNRSCQNLPEWKVQHVSELSPLQLTRF